MLLMLCPRFNNCHGMMRMRANAAASVAARLRASLNRGI
jgi:hypothetical protein